MYLPVEAFPVLFGHHLLLYLMMKMMRMTTLAAADPWTDEAHYYFLNLYFC
jgi:hypothetical protein